MRDQIETNRTRRYRIASILMGSGAASRAGSIADAINAQVAAGSLSAIDAATFGFFPNCTACDSIAVGAGSKNATCADNPWTAADVGKAIDIAGAGPAGATLRTSIAAYVSAGAVTLTDAATTAVAPSATSAAGLAAWGHPASLRIQSPTTSNDYIGSLLPCAAWPSGDQRANLANVCDFGAVGDDATDNADALTKACAWASSRQRRLWLPAGTYRCSVALTLSGYAGIVGDGSALSRLVFTAATGGIAVSLAPQGVGVAPQQFVARGFTLESRAAVTTPALDLAWTAYQANATGQFDVSDVNVTRKADGTGSFAAGIRLTNAFTGGISQCRILGDDNRVSVTGIDIVDSVGVRIHNCDVNRYQCGVKSRVVSATQNEGISLSDCYLYDVNVGLSAVKAISVSLVNCHININGAAAAQCVLFSEVSQSFLVGNLLYVGGNPGDAAGQIAVSCATGNGVVISGNQINGVTAANVAAGIQLATAGYHVIQGNLITNMPIGVNLPASANLNTVVGNQFATITTAAISDAAAANHVALNVNGASADPISGLRWGPASGGFRSGEISTNASWGAYIKGHSGLSADIALADSAGVNALLVKSGSAQVKVYAKASLPAATAGGMICVSDEVGGYTLAFADGANWRRVADRAIVS